MAVVGAGSVEGQTNPILVTKGRRLLFRFVLFALAERTCQVSVSVHYWQERMLGSAGVQRSAVGAAAENHGLDFDA